MSVSRHAENCLRLDLQALMREKKLQKAIDVHEEFREQLVFVKKARDAAQKWLNDPTDPDVFTVDPRADEIDVVYFDSGAKDAQGMPTKCKASLQELLDRIDGDRYRVTNHFIKTVDLREYALKTIDKCDLTIDRLPRSAARTQKKRIILQLFLRLLRKS